MEPQPVARISHEILSTDPVVSQESRKVLFSTEALIRQISSELLDIHQMGMEWIASPKQLPEAMVSLLKKRCVSIPTEENAVWEVVREIIEEDRRQLECLRKKQQEEIDVYLKAGQFVQAKQALSCFVALSMGEKHTLRPLIAYLLTLFPLVEEPVGRELLEEIEHLLSDALSELYPSKETLLSCVYDFSGDAFHAGVEGLEDAPPFPEGRKPLQQYVDELWAALSFDPVHLMHEIQKRGEEQLMYGTPEEAKKELKRRLDLFVETIVTRKKILGAHTEKDATYEKIERFLTNIFEALQKKNNPQAALKVLSDCIEASLYCQMRYLEAAEYNYVPICLGIDRTPQYIFSTLFADFRDRCAKEVVATRFGNDVHVLNMAKKDFGEKLGLPGARSVVIDDIFQGEAERHGYTKDRFWTYFHRLCTLSNFVLNYLAPRISSDMDLRSSYIQLYKDVLLSEDLPRPLYIAHRELVERTRNLSEEQRQHAVTCFLEEHDIVPVRESVQDVFFSFYHSMTLFVQEKKRNEEAPSTSTELGVDEREVFFRLVPKRFSEQASLEVLLGIYHEASHIMTVTGLDKEEQMEALVARYPSLFCCRTQTDEQAILEALSNEEDDVLREVLFESEQVKIQPLLDVLVQIGLVGRSRWFFDRLAAPNKLSVSQNYTALLEGAIQQKPPIYYQIMRDFGADLNRGECIGTTAFGFSLGSMLMATTKSSFEKWAEIASEFKRLGARVTSPNIRELYTEFVLKSPEFVTGAIEAGNRYLLERLLLLGADMNAINAVGLSPMLVAISHNRCEILTDLCRKGCNVNQPLALRYTPMTYAACFSTPAMIRLIHELGGSVHASDREGYSPMTRAIFSRNVRLLEELKNLGADVNQPDEKGRTPLQAAIDWLQKEAVKKLFELGVRHEKPLEAIVKEIDERIRENEASDYTGADRW